MSARIEVRQEGHWYVRLVARNGEIVLVSETYSSKWNAKRAAKRFSKVFGIPWFVTE